MGNYKKKVSKENKMKKMISEYERQVRRHEAFVAELRKAGINEKWLNYNRLNLLEPTLDNPFDKMVKLDPSKLMSDEELKELAMKEKEEAEAEAEAKEDESNNENDVKLLENREEGETCVVL